ncbi:LytTR family DNA-binding domain-containing protein [Oscillospiraceae bacterium MB08-C2-2]|nr:LytTR family DNA-binding domain-containing protein [Oscillospiraceae bacterium MB08-C2-2]
MMKIALCDDNNKWIKQCAALLHDIAEKHQIKMELACFKNGESLLFQYGDAPETVDIIYLDVLMDKMDGMETARKLRSCGCNAQIIFLTSFEDYVFEAFDVHAIHYLLKEDTSQAKFESVFLRAAEHVSQKEEELFSYAFDGKTSVIPFHAISYFEIWRRLVTVHYESDKTAEFYSSMDKLERNLADHHFVRPHRGFLVHLPYISKFQAQSIVLKTGETIPVGTTYMQPLKEAFAQYIKRLHIYNKNLHNGENKR